MIEQPWGDERLKMNGFFIGCVTKENADEIMRLQAFADKHKVADATPEGVSSASSTTETTKCPTPS